MRWQLTKTDASQRLEYLRKSGDFSDCSIIVGSGDTTEVSRKCTLTNTQTHICIFLLLFIVK